MCSALGDTLGSGALKRDTNSPESVANAFVNKCTGRESVDASERCTRCSRLYRFHQLAYQAADSVKCALRTLCRRLGPAHLLPLLEDLEISIWMNELMDDCCETRVRIQQTSKECKQTYNGCKGQLKLAFTVCSTILKIVSVL